MRVGIGIEPADELAHDAGLNVNRGVLVNAELESSAPRIFAAGDVAIFPSHLSGQPFIAAYCASKGALATPYAEHGLCAVEK